MTTDKSAERAAFEAWAATVMLNLKRLYAGYFHEATAFAWLAWQARAALPQQAQTLPVEVHGKWYDVPIPVHVRLVHLEMKAAPQQARDQRCNEVFEALGLDQDRYITEGGTINIPRLRATIKHPSEYLPPDHWMNSPR